MHRDPLEHAPEGDRKRVDRRHQATLIGVGAAVVLLVWFTLANLHDVKIDFWVIDRQAPLVLVILISGVLGALIGALLMRRKGKDKVRE